MPGSFYLSLLIGPVVPVPVPRVVVDALVSIETKSAAGEPGGFQLVFSLSNKSPLHTAFLLTAGQTPLLRVVIVATFNGLPSVLADGVMTRTDFAPGAVPGESRLTVTGVDLTQVMDLIDFTGTPYPAMPAEARVALCIAKYAVYGLIPLVIPSLFVDVPLPVDRIPTHQGTDLAYIKQLAKEAGYVFYISPGPAPLTNVAYWGPEIKIGVPQPALNVDLGPDTNCDAINFTFDTSQAKLPIVFIQNQLTKVTIPIPVPSINPLQPPLGLIPPLPVQISPLRETAKDSAPAALGKALGEASRSTDAVNGAGSLNVLRYGRLLQSRSLVGVRGVGMAFDGLYFVKSVTTTIKRGEIKQSFSLSRNGLVSITPFVPV
jgi:hypothetical protein